MCNRCNLMNVFFSLSDFDRFVRHGCDLWKKINKLHEKRKSIWMIDLCVPQSSIGNVWQLNINEFIVLIFFFFIYQFRFLSFLIYVSLRRRRSEFKRDSCGRQRFAFLFRGSLRNIFFFYSYVFLNSFIMSVLIIIQFQCIRWSSKLWIRINIEGRWILLS